MKGKKVGDVEMSKGSDDTNSGFHIHSVMSPISAKASLRSYATSSTSRRGSIRQDAMGKIVVGLKKRTLNFNKYVSNKEEDDCVLLTSDKYTKVGI